MQSSTNQRTLLNCNTCPTMGPIAVPVTTCTIPEPVCPLPVEPVCALPVQPVCPLVDNSCSRGCAVETPCCGDDDWWLFSKVPENGQLSLDARRHRNKKGQFMMKSLNANSGILPAVGGLLAGATAGATNALLGGSRYYRPYYGGYRRRRYYPGYGGYGGHRYNPVYDGYGGLPYNPVYGGHGGLPYYSGYGGYDDDDDDDNGYYNHRGGLLRTLFPGSVDALGLSANEKAKTLGDKWYPLSVKPLFISNKGSHAIMRNPKLDKVGAYPEIKLPAFITTFPFSVYSNRDQRYLSVEERRLMDQALDSVDMQRKKLMADMASNPAYLKKYQEGFRIVPDLSIGQFVWVHGGPDANATITMMSSMIKLSCAKCDAMKQQVVKAFNPNDVVFDLYGKDEDRFIGVYVLKNGDVYSYEVMPDQDNQIVTEFLGNRTGEKEMMEMMMLLRKLRNTPVQQRRHESGPINYVGYDDGDRIAIYGDDDTTSPVAEDLVSKIRNISAV